MSFKQPPLPKLTPDEIDEVWADYDFHTMPIGERVQAMSEYDPEYAVLPQKDKLALMNKAYEKYYINEEELPPKQRIPAEATPEDTSNAIQTKVVQKIRNAREMSQLQTRESVPQPGRPGPTNVFKPPATSLSQIQPRYGPRIGPVAPVVPGMEQLGAPPAPAAPHLNMQPDRVAPPTPPTSAPTLPVQQEPQGFKSFHTQLSPNDEHAFQAWLQANPDIPFDPGPTSDYDMRGFWQALRAKDPRATSAISPSDNKLHYPDTWKTPFHKTFSNDSIYAKISDPQWTGLETGRPKLIGQRREGVIADETSGPTGDYRKPGALPPLDLQLDRLAAGKFVEGQPKPPAFTKPIPTRPFFMGGGMKPQPSSVPGAEQLGVPPAATQQLDIRQPVGIFGEAEDIEPTATAPEKFAARTIRSTMGATAQGVAQLGGLSAWASNYVPKVSVPTTAGAINLNLGEIGETLGRVGRGMAKSYEATRPSMTADPLKDPSSLADPEWWGEQFGQGLGSIAPALVVGAASRNVVLGLISTGKITPKLALMIAKWSAPATAGLTEGLQAGGAAYDEAIQEGKTPKEASRRAALIASGTAATSIAAFKLGIFNDRIKSGLARGGASMAMGGLEEGTQEAIENLVKGQPITQNVATAAAGGAITEGAMGLAMGHGPHIEEPSPPPPSPRYPPPPAPPQQPSVNPWRTGERPIVPEEGAPEAEQRAYPAAEPGPPPVGPPGPEPGAPPWAPPPTRMPTEPSYQSPEMRREEQSRRRQMLQEAGFRKGPEGEAPAWWPPPVERPPATELGPEAETAPEPTTEVEEPPAAVEAQKPKLPTNKEELAKVNQEIEDAIQAQQVAAEAEEATKPPPTGMPQKKAAAAARKLARAIATPPITEEAPPTTPPAIPQQKAAAAEQKKTDTQLAEEQITRTLQAELYTKDPSPGSWDLSAVSNTAKAMAKMLQALKSKPWTKSSDIGKGKGAEIATGRIGHIKKLRDIGLAQIAWDKEGNPYYAAAGAPMKEGLLTEAEIDALEKADVSTQEEEVAAPKPKAEKMTIQQLKDAGIGIAGGYSNLRPHKGPRGTTVWVSPSENPPAFAVVQEGTPRGSLETEPPSAKLYVTKAQADKQAAHAAGLGYKVRLIELETPSTETKGGPPAATAQAPATEKPVSKEEQQYNTAAQFAKTAGRVSPALLQRALKVGYGTANRIIEKLQERGVVTAAVGNVHEYIQQREGPTPMQKAEAERQKYSRYQVHPLPITFSRKGGEQVASQDEPTFRVIDTEDPHKILGETYTSRREAETEAAFLNAELLGEKTEEAPVPEPETGEAGFFRLPTFGKPPAPMSPRVEFLDPDVEKAVTSASRVVKNTIADKWDTIKETVKGWGRVYQHLPRKTYNNLITELKRFEKQKGIASADAVTNVYNNIGTLDKNQFNLFWKYIGIKDMEETLAIHINQGTIDPNDTSYSLPFGLTPSTLPAEVAHMQQAVDADPVVQAALDRRKQTMDTVRTNLIEAMKYAGTNIDNRFTREDYMRHRIMEKLEEKNLRRIRGRGKALRTPTGTYLMKRGANNLEYSMDYITSEYEVMSEMMHDTAKANLIGWIKNNPQLNIMPALKQEAANRGMDPRDLAAIIDMKPDGFVAWQPKEGSTFYTAQTLLESKAKEVFDALGQEIGVSSDDLRARMVLGAKPHPFVIPEEVAATLDEEGVRKTGVGKASAAALRKWKQWALLNPFTLLKYNLRNLTGDAEKTFVGNWKAFRRLPEAGKDLIAQRRRHEFSPKLRAWYERGGFQSNLQAQEIGDLDNIKLLETFLEDRPGSGHPVLRKFRPGRINSAYWNNVRMATDFREGLLRYANFLEYLHQLEKNNGTPENYGASTPRDVDSLTSNEDKAYKLSNDLMGAYDEVSSAGRYARDHAMPFWSYQELNLRSHAKLIRNAARDKKLAGLVGRKLLGTAVIRSPYLLYRAGSMAIKMAGFYAAWRAINNRQPEEEKSLRKEIRDKPHVVLGRTAEGKVRYFPNIGNIADIGQWLDPEDDKRIFKDWANGKISFQQAVWAVAKNTTGAILEKGVQSATPFAKTPLELWLGKSFYPDPSHPRPIHDRWEYFLDSLQLGDIYRQAFGKPRSQLGEGKTGLAWAGTAAANIAKKSVTYETDPEESAYYDIRDLESEYNKAHGKGTPGTREDVPKDDALRNLKLSLRKQDLEAFKKYLAEYYMEGGTAAGMAKSIAMMKPLAHLKKSERQKFVDTLSEDDKHRLEQAQRYWEETFKGTKLPEYKEAAKEVTDKARAEARRIKQEKAAAGQ